METMSQGPRAVTSSQRSPISVHCWWPAMSRRITPPLTEKEIKVRRGTFSWRHTHRSWESQHSFQATLIYHRLRQRMWDCFFPPTEKWKGLVMESLKEDLRSHSQGQVSILATCGTGKGGGVSPASLPDGTWIWKRDLWAETKTVGAEVPWATWEFWEVVQKECTTQRERRWDLG